MKKQYVAVAVFVLTVLVVAFLAVSLSGLNPFNNSSPTQPPTQTPSPPTSSPTSTPKPSPTPSTANGPTAYTYKIVKTYPHNTTAFTEGLVFDNSVLYESTGTFE